MRAAFAIPAVLLALATPWGRLSAADPDQLLQREAFFETRIRPVLAASCFKCHGGDKTSGGLRIDSRESLVKGGENGPAIVPNDLEQSLLIRAVRRTSEDLQMPPDNTLPESVVKDLEAWVKDGAYWPESDPSKPDPFAQQKHWAFQTVKPVAIPDNPSGWSTNPIDRFIYARLDAEKLKPAELADKRTILRRLYFDLVGLPPSRDDVAAFLADDSSDAYSKLVDRLLESPQYGERWGRHWMDVVRYADTAGDNADYPIPEIRLYRDYIIDSFNSDKPFDTFVKEQLAGDILAKNGPRERYAEQVVATGFLALSRRYATAPYELWHLTLEDTVDTVGRSFLGLSLRCARCHDHKFDPVTAADYYSLYGIFASTKFPYAGSEEFQSMKAPRREFQSLLPEGEIGTQVAQSQARLAVLKEEIAKREAQKPEPKSDSARELKRLHEERLTLERRVLPTEVPVAYAVTEGAVADTAIHLKGDPAQPGVVVPRGVLKFLEGEHPPVFPKDASGRLELANWLTRPDHPLTARVMVNRIWQNHFGRGLVITPSNFGMRGEAPTHPELLDWLAARFVESGWSVKSMHRLILNSTTYRLSSRHDPDNALLDPSNKWYSRFERRRLDAEAMRDAILATSGQLDLSRPGEHPFPPIHQWNWTQHNPFKQVYPSMHRSVYLMTQRLQRHPYLMLFDGPDTNASVEARTVSTVPLQALFLMNSDFIAESSDAFAARLLKSSSDPRERITTAFQLAYNRAPEEKEIERGLTYLRDYEKELEQTSGNNAKRELASWSSYARTLLTANEFRFID
ncbi:MAG: PSD1 and planctomycete cytochrome C domain-containing protein [Planctomycetaceae bacterium]